MGDILVVIFLVIMMIAGMVLFFGGIAGLAINGYRSMRRAQQSDERRSAAGAEADA